MSDSEPVSGHHDAAGVSAAAEIDANNKKTTLDTDNKGRGTESVSLKLAQTDTSKKSQYGQNVIIIQNSGNLNMEGLDASLLKCVKEVLASAEGQHSFMIVNRGEDGSSADEEQTTYIIDVNAGEKVSVTSHGDQNTKYSSSDKSSSSNTTSDTVVSTSSWLNLSETNVVPEQKGDIKDQSDSSPGALDYQEQVEISFVSCSSHVDENVLTSEKEFSVEAVSSNPRPLHTTSQASGSMSTTVKSTKNLRESSQGHQDTQQPHLNMTVMNAHANDSSSSLPSSSHSSVTAPHRDGQKPAEYLLQMAKKFIEEKTHNKRLSNGPSNGSEVTAPQVEITEEKCGTESVITMYLSSPSELQDKIQKLKTNSPVIVMQAGDDTSGNDREGAEGNSDSNDMVSRIGVKSRDMSPVSEASVSSDHSSDNFVSAITTLSSSGMVYRCSECGYSSHNKHYYKQHVDLVHNEDRPYKCPHCDYAGKRRHALLEHMVVHSNQRPFTCDHCNASFRKKGHLTNHVKLHTSQRLVHCGVCNIQLPDTEAFESHLRKIHNTDKLYKCKLCDHTVVDRNAMLRHLETHNDSVIYFCPNCPSLFNDEDSLLAHMRSNHEFKFVEGKPNPDSITDKNDDVIGKVPTANIMCSECGFVCSSAEIMQQHMWVHIKREEKPAVPAKDMIKICPVNKDEGSSTLGVLKMNVDLGQKTLPNNVVYQCSSCSFTSSDNSVFIKHMLAHKTQDKRQRVVASESAKFTEEREGVNDKPTITSTVSKSKPVSYYSDSVGRQDSQAKLTSGVPFIYDKASARFRCVICGYHCEFQRTIKAHIWKHSGHQNIEYPTFDKPSRSKASTSPPLIQVLANKAILPKQTDSLAVKKENVVTTSVPALTSKPQAIPVLRTRTGETIQLVPVNPLTTTYNPADIIQVKDNSVILPTESGKTSAVTKYLESIAFTGKMAANKKNKTADVTVLTSATTVQSAVSTAVDVKTDVSQSKMSTEANLSESNLTTHTSTSQPDDSKHNESGSSAELDESYSEPSVVVEVVEDTVPSSSGFTGMKSQQGSPRVQDLEASGGETKLSKTLLTCVGRSCSLDLDTSLSEHEKTAVPEKKNLKAIQVKDVDPFKNLHSYSARLRCPICDCLLTEDFRVHLLNCQKKPEKGKEMSIETEKRMSNKESAAKFDYDHDDLGEDTDSVESSDEATMSGSNSQQKSGICSSLLAVIEQLRERSKSESEDDRQGAQTLKKGGKRKGRQEEEVDFESIDDVQNIEKISDNGEEKFRCSLCHYTSHRICNIKLHMKTHRQKKPSECSLCDFSSSSSEALQEHMLKHCKVRTYACKFCPQSFNHKSTLRAHLRAHKDQEPFLCAYCVFETTSPMEYREHMQVHSGCSSRLRCPGCDIILSNKEELTAHLLKCKGSLKKNKTHTDVSAIKSDVEEQSEEGEKLEAEPQLDSGMTQHACVVRGCAFSSTSLKELQEHLSVHCNPSLLVCNLCDFKALHSRSLKSHMKRHANDQRYVQQPLEQYKCNLCGYVCHHLPSLKSHMWRHASDQSYSYEFTNDVINAAIDHDTRVDADGEADDPELLDRVINSERKILEGELTKCSKGDGQRPICWVTFRCCSCGFETINKAKLNVHMRTHSDIIQKALDIPRKSGSFPNKTLSMTLGPSKLASKRSQAPGSTSPGIPVKVIRSSEAT